MYLAREEMKTAKPKHKYRFSVLTSKIKNYFITFVKYTME